MTKQSFKDNNGVEKLINDMDRHSVFIRPKAIVGSSGTVWASEMVRLWHSTGNIFMVEGDSLGCPQYTETFCSLCHKLHNYAFQYMDMTTEEDINKLEQGTCSKLEDYENQRL